MAGPATCSSTKLENRTFGRTLSSQTNFEAVVSDTQFKRKQNWRLRMSTPLLPLTLKTSIAKRELERAITGRVEAFLREMGDMFAFVGSQYRVEVGEREFYIDLLLYHLVVGRGLSRIRSGGLSSLLSVIPRV
jgi:predicted nuclease of restriction endonuclease-like (RecB) superfamily